MGTYNKLVRNKIPGIIESKGEKPKTRVIDDEEYLIELVKKLGEEYEEFQEDPSIEELADIQEVVNALAEALGESAQKLEAARAKKAEERGGFSKRIFLETVDG